MSSDRPALPTALPLPLSTLPTTRSCLWKPRGWLPSGLVAPVVPASQACPRTREEGAGQSPETPATACVPALSWVMGRAPEDRSEEGLCPYLCFHKRIFRPRGSLHTQYTAVRIPAQASGNPIFFLQSDGCLPPLSGSVWFLSASIDTPSACPPTLSPSPSLSLSQQRGQGGGIIIAREEKHVNPFHT